MNFINKESLGNKSFIKDNINNICASLQNVIIEILVEKVELAIEKLALKT